MPVRGPARWRHRPPRALTVTVRDRRRSQFWKQPGRGDGQVADTDPGGVVNGVGDRRGGADNANLADALGAHRVQVRVRLLNPCRLDVTDIRAGRDVVAGEIAVNVVA